MGTRRVKIQMPSTRTSTWGKKTTITDRQTDGRHLRSQVAWRAARTCPWAVHGSARAHELMLIPSHLTEQLNAMSGFGYPAGRGARHVNALAKSYRSAARSVLA